MSSGENLRLDLEQEYRQKLMRIRSDAKETSSLLDQLHNQQMKDLTDARDGIPIAELRQLICQYAEYPLPRIVTAQSRKAFWPGEPKPLQMLVQQADLCFADIDPNLWWQVRAENVSPSEGRYFLAKKTNF